MSKIILAVVLVVTAQMLHVTQALRHPLRLCQRFERNCRKYDEYCSNEDSAPENNTVSNATSNHVATMWPSCCDLARLTNYEATSGTYSTYGPGGHFSTQLVYCDVQPDEGAWTVIQRRTNGTLLFNRTWHEYVDGFGALNSEFWYGLSNMHWLTRNGQWELKVTMIPDNGPALTSSYSDFRVGSSDDNYRLTWSASDGEYDILNGHSGQPFTTYDNQNNNQGSCPKTGWWYTKNCINDKAMNLNGEYDIDTEKGIKWTLTARESYQIKQTEMKIRPKNCLEANPTNQ